MKRIDRYLLLESLPPFLFGLLLYASLIILSSTLPRLQWIVGVPAADLSVWFLLQFPQAFVYTLPMALLLAVLLVFGQLSASNEILALQAGGVTVRRLTFSFILLGLLSAGVILYLNERVLPHTNERVSSLWWQIASGGSGLYRLARQNVPVGGYTLTFERTDRRTDELFDVRLQGWEERRLTVIFAERAQFVEEQLQLYGYDLLVLDLNEPQGEDAEAILRDLVRLRNRAPNNDAPLNVVLDASLDEIINRHGGGGFEDSRSIRQSLEDARDPSLTPEARREAEVLFHRKLAEPFASFALLIVALPLAVLYGRSRSIAFGLSLAVTLLYYFVFTLGQLFAQAGVLPVPLGVWFGNVLLFSIGLYLLQVKTTLR